MRYLASLLLLGYLSGFVAPALCSHVAPDEPACKGQIVVYAEAGIAGVSDECDACAMADCHSMLLCTTATVAVVAHRSTTFFPGILQAKKAEAVGSQTYRVSSPTPPPRS